MQRLTSAISAAILVSAGSLFAASAIMPAYASTQDFAYGESAHNLLFGLLIALTNNVDNLGARIAYSIHGTVVSASVNLWIAVITFVISTGAALLGATAVGSFGTEAASIVAMMLLCGLGVLMINQARQKPWHDQAPPQKDAASLWNVLLRPHHADIDASKHIDFKEGTVLGIALSINNIGGGLSAGVIGVPPVLVGLLSALLSFLALWAGNYVAEFFVKRGIANKANIAGGILLILIGVKQVF
jgi:putative sporulation protein YtaF